MTSLALAVLIAVGLTSASSNAALGQATGPSFVQQVSAHRAGVSSLTLTPAAAVTTGDRLIVEIGVWNAAAATATAVTDSAGNTYTELTHFKAPDGTEQSIWTAPLTAGGGTKPTITAKVTSAADIGAAALEYAGLSTAAGTAALDVQAHATGTTTAAPATVTSGPTPATTSGSELALGFYTDSGFGDTLTAGTGYTSRVNLAPTPDMELLAEDQTTTQGATPAATTATGPNTIWLMTTIVLRHA